MRKKAQLIRFGVIAAAGAAGLFANPITWFSPQNASLTTQAEARVGRPLTPGSIAGVNRRVDRRTARRAYYGAAGYYGTGAALGTAAAVGAAGAYLGNQNYNSYSGQYNGTFPVQYNDLSSMKYYEGPIGLGAYAFAGPIETTSAWCASRYRSYNPSTGMFLGYDGQYHPCP